MDLPTKVTCAKCLSTAAPNSVLAGSAFITALLLIAGLSGLFGFFYWASQPAPDPTSRAIGDVFGNNAGQAAQRLADSQEPRQKMRLGFGELGILLIVAVGPVFAYQLWRGKNRRPRCSQCGSDDVLPADSPRARQLQAQKG